MNMDDWVIFKHLGKAAKHVGKKLLNNPARAMEIATNIGISATSKSPLLISATAPEVIKFVHQGRVCIWVKFIEMCEIYLIRYSIYNRDEMEI